MTTPSSERMVAGRSTGAWLTLLALALASAGLRPLRALLPYDMVWRPAPGRVYVLGPVASDDGAIPFAARDSRVAPAGATPRLEPGTSVRVLRLEEDGMRHPLPLVRVLDGPRAGERGHVTRWHLRHSKAASFAGLTPAMLMSSALALIVTATLWAIVIVLGERPQRLRSKAPRHAE